MHNRVSEQWKTEWRKDWNLRRTWVSQQPHQNPISESKLSMRRIVALLAGACVLMLIAGGIDAQCSDHSMRSISESADAAMPGHNASSHELPAKKSEQPKPCKSPAVPCCVAMTSCATMAIAGNRSSILIATATQDLFSLELTKPFSRIAAPEPPPPKA